MQGTARALFIKRRKGEKSVLLEWVQTAAGGFDGDHHTGSSKRRQIYGLQDALQNRRGMFVKALFPGIVRVADRGEVLWQPSAAENLAK